MWTVEYLQAAFDERAALPAEMRARLGRMIDVIETSGLLNLHRDWAKPLSDKLWELRVNASEGIARGLYVTMTERRVVVLHVFEKKTQKTPRRAMEVALDRMKRMM